MPITPTPDKLTPQTTDERYMARALELARHGAIGAPPNPMVGAVIVCDGRIIGEGWHRRCGGPHAEVNAVGSVSSADEHLLAEATIYVTLEPCSHWGRTPPCADMLVEKRLRRVVVGCTDPFAEVRGRGIRRLREAGIEVEVGVLEDECRHLNRRFFTFHTEHRPWVTLKWAQSADGFIDRQRSSHADGEAVRFSSPWTQMLVHRLRATHQAILVGRRTWELDEPSLTTRLWPGASPRRFVVGEGRLWENDEGRHLTPVAEATTPRDILGLLHGLGLQTLLVEGGTRTLQSFIDARLYDQLHVERTDLILGSGVAAPCLPADAKVLPLDVNVA